MLESAQLADRLLEATPKELLKHLSRRRTTNLGWMLRNWQQAVAVSFEYHPQATIDGELVFDLRRGGQWASDFASLSVCWHWLDRPVFRSLPFTLVREDGTQRHFVIGDPEWKRLDRLSGHGTEGYRTFLAELGLEDGPDAPPEPAADIVERWAGSSSFQTPENFDKVAEGPGWVMYAGGNDWENCITGIAVMFPNDESSSRVWMHVKFPSRLKKQVDANTSQKAKTEEVRKYAHQAWKLWVRLAREEHKADEDGGRTPWPDAFKDALERPEMRKFVDTSGRDQTRWMEA